MSWVSKFHNFFWHAQKLRLAVYLMAFSIVWVEPLILEMPRSLSINLYLRPFIIVIYGKFHLNYLCLFRLFWSVNCTSLVCKLSVLFQTILDLWPVFILEIFSCWDIKKGQFQFLVTFLAVFLVCKLYIRSLYIITYFEHGQCFIWGFIVFSFLVFSVFIYLRFTLSSNFSWSGNVEVLVCKLYMLGL